MRSLWRREERPCLGLKIGARSAVVCPRCPARPWNMGPPGCEAPSSPRPHPRRVLPKGILDMTRVGGGSRVGVVAGRGPRPHPLPHPPPGPPPSPLCPGLPVPNQLECHPQPPSLSCQAQLPATLSLTMSLPARALLDGRAVVLQPLVLMEWTLREGGRGASEGKNA